MELPTHSPVCTLQAPARPAPVRDGNHKVCLTDCRSDMAQRLWVVHPILRPFLVSTTCAAQPILGNTTQQTACMCCTTLACYSCSRFQLNMQSTAAPDLETCPWSCLMAAPPSLPGSASMLDLQVRMLTYIYLCWLGSACMCALAAARTFFCIC